MPTATVTALLVIVALPLMMGGWVFAMAAKSMPVLLAFGLAIFGIAFSAVPTWMLADRCHTSHQLRLKAPFLLTPAEL
jgi:hypothetical protein